MHGERADGFGNQQPLALVCASSQGLGFAVTLNGRDASKLDSARDELRRRVEGAEVGCIAADLTMSVGRATCVSSIDVTAG